MSPHLRNREKCHQPLQIVVVYTLLAVAVVAAAMLALSLGSVDIPLTDSLRYLLARIQGSVDSNQQLAATAERILLTIRLPRLGMAMTVGATLAISGLVYQNVLRNSLAEPFILGVSSGAAFFAVLGRACFGSAYLPGLLSAFVGGVFTILLLFAIAGVRRGRDETQLLLVGVMLNFFMGALMMLTLFLLRPSQMPEFLHLWMGSFSGIWSWEIVVLAVMLVVGALFFVFYARALGALSISEEWAESVGFDAAGVRFRVLLVASLMVAATVAFVGMIGFVGLLVPHLFRLLLPGRIVIILPATLLGGAAFMLLADTVARQLLITHTELPVGVISAFLGSPLFLYMLMQKGRQRRGLQA